ncbi:ScbR family autoregulator-binding transcription factor [Streptomyces sp. NBC_01264]|uniref:ScbR family autoregulator-binding transcription factor n=1 Tax=Streptomyces sp. NBC_01264 TaxID=2903804 RepID=UPI00224EA18F|nr:ScbR family autoregulator-binding transcription factor [Streptomyces sp. NBC_01264]MCX4783641.1 ScbR family autoregulator-binding transcription factor [Streptomyces sp. NBC_01264]
MAIQERAVRTRAAVLRSAAEIFDTDGFVSASLSAIAQRAGVSSGALHFHFANKGTLAEAIETAAEQRLRRITGPAPDGPQDDGSQGELDPIQNLVETSHHLFDRLTTDIILRAGFTLGCEPAWPSPVDLHGQWRDWIESALRRASQLGALADGTKPEDVVTVVAASTVGFEALGRKDPVWLSQQRLGQFWQFILPRLVPPGTGPLKGT